MLSLSFSLWPPSTSPVPPIYTCIPVHFVSTRSIAAHASPILLLLFPPSPFPSSSYSRSAHSLLSPLVPREHVREVRFPLASLSLPPRQPALVLLVLFAPFRFTTGAGRLCRSSSSTALPALATIARSPFCIARPPPPTSRFSPRLCPSLPNPSPLSRPQFLALSDARPSRSRSRGREIGGGEDRELAFTSGSSFGPAPVSCFA